MGHFPTLTAVRSVVQSHIKEIKKFYEDGLKKKPNIEGHLVLQWTVGPMGKVVEAGIKSSNLNSPEVENCSIQKLKAWTFPSPPLNEVAVIEFPIILSLD